MMHIELIYNPVSGRGRAAKTVESLLGYFEQAGFALNVHKTELAGDAKSLAAELPQETELIIAVGGDGTVNEVINGMDLSVPLLLCPAGTANVMAFELNYPKDLKNLPAMVKAFRLIDYDLGRCGDRLFALMLSAGIDADVVHRLAARRGGAITKASYIMPALQAWAHFNNQEIQLNVDGREVFAGKALVIVSNIKHYAGEFELFPDKNVNDGFFKALVFPANANWKYSSLLFGMATGKHLDYAGVSVFTGQRFEITSELPHPVQLDGEPFAHTPVSVELVPKALKVVVP